MEFLGDILLILLLCVLIALFLFLCLYFFYFFRGILQNDAPYVGSFPNQITLLDSSKTIENFLQKGNKKIIDLGCGDGKVLRFFAKKFPQHTYFGCDFHLFALLVGRMTDRALGYKNITLIHKDIQKIKLEDVDVVYIYLFSDYMARLEDRVFTTKKQDAIVICNTFSFKNHEPFEIISDGKDKIYLYK